MEICDGAITLRSVSEHGSSGVGELCSADNPLRVGNDMAEFNPDSFHNLIYSFQPRLERSEKCWRNATTFKLGSFKPLDSFPSVPEFQIL